MTIDRLKNIISGCCNDVVFFHNGKNCGIFPSVENSVPSYSVWCGEQNRVFYDVDQLLSSNFFDGSSMRDIINTISILVS